MHQCDWLEMNSDSDGDTPLHFAAASGRSSLLFNYLSLGYNINSANRLGWTPLMQAARNSHLACVKLLLDFEANVSCRNSFGICSLSHAAASGNLEIVRAILQVIVKRGLNIRDTELPISPLFFAILFGHVDILRYLNNKSFDLRRLSDIGEISPVMFASILNNKETMELLKRRGISPMKIAINISQNLNKSKSPCTSSNTLQVPLLCLSNDIAPDTPIFSPSIQHNFIVPFQCNSVQTIEKKLRKFSNISITSVPNTPDLSPILFPDTPRPSTGSYSASIKSNTPANDYLNTRFSISPAPRMASASNNSTSMYSNSKENIFSWMAPLLKGNAKMRSASHNVLVSPIEDPEVESYDDVFSSSAIDTDAANTNHNNNNELEFIELLRRNSLDSCVSLFQKHEIDMDMFLTLSKSDLNEIGVDWDKRDNVLELIYLLNKNGVK